MCLLVCAVCKYREDMGRVGNVKGEVYWLNILETISISASAAAIFSAEEGWGRAPPKRKDIFAVLACWSDVEFRCCDVDADAGGWWRRIVVVPVPRFGLPKLERGEAWATRHWTSGLRSIFFLILE